MWYVSLGCHIESNETNEEAIVTEFVEELGLNVWNENIKYLYTFHEIATFEDGTIIDMYVNTNDLLLQKMRWRKPSSFLVKIISTL